MRKNKLVIISGLAVSTFSAVAVSLSSGLPNMFELFGVGSSSVITSSITFSGSAQALGNRMYSVSGQTSGGKTLYLISTSWDAPSEGNVMAYRDGASSATTFYISEQANGLNGVGNPSYFGMQRITSVDVGVSASSYVRYWESYDPNDWGDYVDTAPITKSSHVLSLLRNGHYMKFNLYGQLYAGEVSSVSFSYTCSTEGRLLDKLELGGSVVNQFYVDDEFSADGLVASAVYSDGQKVDVTSQCSFSGYDMSTAGNQTVTVRYLDQTATYSIRVIEQGGSTEPFIGKFVYSYRELVINSNHTGTYSYNNGELHVGHFTWEAVGNTITIVADDIEEFNHDNFGSAGYGAYNLFDYNNKNSTNTITYNETTGKISATLYCKLSNPATRNFSVVN